MQNEVMTVAEAKEVVEQTAVAPRVTEQSIKDKISDFYFYFDGMTTICIITMWNGFKVIGHSTPASPENYSQAVGEACAYDNAFKQLWQLEGYLLCEKLSQR